MTERFINRLYYGYTMVKPFGENMITMIKVKTDTRQMLQGLKIIERESYDEVIQRLIQAFAENQLSINSQTRKIISNRLNKLKEGKALSFNQILEKIEDNEKKRTSDGKKGNSKINDTPGRGIEEEDVLGS